MELCAPQTPPVSASSSFLCGMFDGKVREFCSSVASAVICNLFYVIFILYFAVVGFTMGAMAGAMIGVKVKSGFFHGAAVGAILWLEVVKALVVFWHSDDGGLGRRLLPLVEVFTRLVDGGSLREHNQVMSPLPGGSFVKVARISITAKNIFDTSKNKICCAVCLQDFELGEIAGRWPQCHHMFHVPCIAEWLIRRSSCPLCRRDL